MAHTPRPLRYLNPVSAALAYASFSSLITDILVWVCAVELSAVARVDFNASSVAWGAATVLVILLAGGQLFIGEVARLYRGRYQAGSFDEMRAVAMSVSAVSVIGYNYRLSNILAALGRAQLARLDGTIARRRVVRQTYTDCSPRFRGCA